MKTESVQDELILIKRDIESLRKEILQLKHSKQDILSAKLPKIICPKCKGDRSIPDSYPTGSALWSICSTCDGDGDIVELKYMLIKLINNWIN